jgi:predicted RNA binding protein YcfA (HicA-like mRNA interferase family)
MTKLPRVSGQQCVSSLLKTGFRIKRQHGSHIILRRDQPFAQVVVPDHAELDTGTCDPSSGRRACRPMNFANCSKRPWL